METEEEPKRGTPKGLRYLVPEKLAFITLEPGRFPEFQKEMLANGATCVSSDLHQQYIPIRTDFGPVNLGIVCRFCRSLAKKLSSMKTGFFCDQAKAYVCNKAGVLIYCIEPGFESLANASFLLGSFLILHYGFTAQEACVPFCGRSSPFKLKPFRDASGSDESDTISLLDCLSGLCKAVDFGWFNFKTFDLETYEVLDNVCGDVHQICPKFVAFRGPNVHDDSNEDESVCKPAELIDIFCQLKVSCVVRLNEADTYDPSIFTNANLQHYDVDVTESDIPSDDMIEKFLDICDKQAVLAVHCRTGLGRTGTMIALWLMKRKRFTATEAIAWIRIVRTGCIMGSQQKFLMYCEKRIWIGNKFSKNSERNIPLSTFVHEKRDPSPFRPFDFYAATMESESSEGHSDEEENEEDIEDEELICEVADIQIENAGLTTEKDAGYGRNSSSILSTGRSETSKQGARVRWKG